MYHVKWQYTPKLLPFSHLVVNTLVTFCNINIIFNHCSTVTSKIIEKYLWKSDILSKDASRKCHSFKHFAGKNQLPDFYISGTLVENDLKLLLKTQCNAQLKKVKKDGAHYWLLTLVTMENTKSTNNNKHDWTPVKYLNVLNHNRTQKQLQH